MKLELNYEDAKALYFDGGLIQSNQLLRRVKIGGAERYYYLESDDGGRTFFTSVTTASRIAIPTSPFLIEWMISMGSKENAENFAAKAAAFGTTLHRVCLEMYLLGEETKMEEIVDFTRNSAYVFGLKQEETEKWVREIKRSLLAFMQWVEDFKVRPIAVEFPIANSEMGLGGTIDLPCYITIKENGYFGEVYKSGDRKGEPKETTQEREVIAIVDLKSSLKGNFYEEHEFQLEAYKRMWNNIYPQYHAEKIYNWSPKEWKTTPSYTFADQTGGLYSEDEAFNAVLSIARRKAKRVQDIKELVISETLNRTKPVAEQFSFISLEESLNQQI